MRRIRRIWSEFLTFLPSFFLYIRPKYSGCSGALDMVLINWVDRVHKLREELCEDTLAYDMEF